MVRSLSAQNEKEAGPRPLLLITPSPTEAVRRTVRTTAARVGQEHSWVDRSVPCRKQIFEGCEGCHRRHLDAGGRDAEALRLELGRAHSLQLPFRDNEHSLRIATAIAHQRLTADLVYRPICLCRASHNRRRAVPNTKRGRCLAAGEASATVKAQ